MTILLAKSIGAFSLLIGVSMFLKKKMLMHVLDELLHHRALAYIVGMAELFIGILIVVMHAYLNGFLSILITITGWMILIEGAAYVLMPQSFTNRVLDWLHKSRAYYAVAGIYLALGIYLVYAGFILN